MTTQTARPEASRPGLRSASHTTHPRPHNHHQEQQTMTTPADELAAAAERVRTLVSSISPPNLAHLPFHADDTFVTQGEDGLYDVAQTETPELAAYLAAMGPTVGLALAEWLGCLAMLDPSERGGDAEFIAARQRYERARTTA
ncbi:hypothetical protein ACFV20_19405 [Streptomyces sp. NPDC059696]|uniref:hypothetical protein n=1 Tax=Streptomyces sp. NPDC059696 TaxID=3346911 RepID=UPI00368B06CC